MATTLAPEPTRACLEACTECVVACHTCAGHCTQSGAATGPINHPVPGRSRGQLLSNGKAVGLATLYWVGCPLGSELSTCGSA